MIFCGLLFFEYFECMNDNYMTFPSQNPPIQLLNVFDNDSENEDDIINDMISWSIEPYSICYIFNKNKKIIGDNNNDKYSRIAIVTVSDLSSYPHPSSWIPLSRMNRLQYAHKFNYDYCDFPRDWDFTTLRETRWVKFGALYTVLKNYKYVVWIDTDTLFWNKPYISFDKYALEWFKNYTNLSVLFSNHAKHSENINAGIFIIKHNNFSFKFLENCYKDYVNQNITKGHADQDAFQDYIEKYNVNNEIMIIPAGNLQKIYVQASPQKYEDDYKKLYEKQGRTIIFHRVGGGAKKYFQMDDVIRDLMDKDILNKMKIKCLNCFENINKTWREAIRKVDMNDFENQKGNKILRLNQEIKVKYKYK